MATRLSGNVRRKELVESPPRLALGGKPGVVSGIFGDSDGR